MENNLNTMDGTEVFKLAPVDINHLYRRSGLSGNNLSSFRYNAEQAAVSSPSEFYKVLAESNKFRQIARQLLEPDLKVEFNSGGGGIANDKYYALLSAGDNSVLVQMLNSDDNILLLLFPDWNSFLKWWIGLYASTGMGSYQNVFPKIMATEVLVCALHCIDIYRRSYMESMLEYRSGLNLSLTTQDFVELLKRSLTSKDKRWVLPTIFEITPGLKNSSISLKQEHIKQIEELGFVVSDQATLTLSERSRIMGTEFITSWIGAIGMQATAWINKQERSLSRIFLAPTAFANHLFSFEIGSAGESHFRHQALTGQELERSLQKWLETIKKAVGDVDGTIETTGNKTPKAKFCGQCGTEIKPGKKFCTSCGTAI